MIADPTGYEAQARELQLADVKAEQVSLMQLRQTPLGFDTVRWSQCIAELLHTLADAAIEADVRLQGTASTFFSCNPQKRFPQSTNELLGQVEVADRGVALEVWREAGYEGTGPKPGRHFWDSRYKLMLATDRSDYDIQVSSDAVEAAVNQQCDAAGVIDEERVSRHGGNYKHEYVTAAVPRLGYWAARWSVATSRNVSIAGFASCGPGGDTAFSETDWRMKGERKES